MQFGATGYAEIMNFDAAGSRTIQLPRGRRHFTGTLAGYSKNDMNPGIDPARPGVRERTQGRGGVMSPAQPGQRPVMARLHAIFNGDIGLLRQFFQQVEYARRHAVRPSTHDKTYDFGMSQSLREDVPQQIRRAVGVRTRLKIS